MKTHVPLEGICEVRAERRLLSLIQRELGLRGERKVAERAGAVGEPRAIERIFLSKLGQLRRQPLPLRVPPQRVRPCFEGLESAHRWLESTDERTRLGSALQIGLWYKPSMPSFLCL